VDQTKLEIGDVQLSVKSYKIEGTPTFSAVTIERCENRDGFAWAIRQGSACLNKKGMWEEEPLPSSRTAAFLRRCRFESIEDAVKAWTKAYPVDT
jgi:hypothetical protein